MATSGKDFRELAERLLHFSILCHSCGWPENHVRDIARGGALAEAIADTLDEKPVVLNMGEEKVLLLSSPL